MLLALLCLAAVGAGAADADADASEIATAEGAGNPAQPLAAAPESEDAQRAKAQLKATGGAPKATGGAPVPGPAAAGNAGGGDLGINADYVMIGAGVVGTLCCMAGGWFLLNQGGPKKRKFRGDAVFLVGPCDSGKTAVMFQLRDGESGGKLRPTHTSMALNEETFALSGIDCKPVRVIDFPGHSRLRPQLFDMIEDCRVLIFVVDCSTFASKGQAACSVEYSPATNAAYLTLLCVYGMGVTCDCICVWRVVRVSNVFHANISARSWVLPPRSFDVGKVAKGELRLRPLRASCVCTCALVCMGAACSVVQR